MHDAMRVCFVTDFRSPIARSWISYFVLQGHEVHVISSYPCPPDSVAVTSLHVVPIAFSSFAQLARSTLTEGAEARRSAFPLLTSLRDGWAAKAAIGVRHWLGPLDVYCHVTRTRMLIQEIKPDLVHAMRIPFEGILAALAVEGVPLLLSTWGNDLTLFAKRYPLIKWLTRKALQRADALHSDTLRDIRLATSLGFDRDKPSITLPGAGGVRLDIFYPGSQNNELLHQLDIPPRAPVVVYPRRLRPGSVCAEQFFAAIPMVLEREPRAVFVCPGLRGCSEPEDWIRKFGIREAVRLLPEIGSSQMADLFRLAHVTVSPSIHDGTPNTLVEAMACGCFPVAGDIESIREWITDGVNGLLCDPTDPESLAQAIVRALSDAELRCRAAEYNLKLIAERAEYGKGMAQAEAFYHRVIGSSQSRASDT